MRNAESRVTAIEVVYQLDHQHELETLLQTAEDRLEKVLNLCSSYQQDTQAIHENLNQQMLACLTGLGVNEEQTQMIMSLCHTVQHKQVSLTQPSDIKQGLRKLISLTSQTLHQQQPKPKQA